MVCLEKVLGKTLPKEKESIKVGDDIFANIDGILRSSAYISEAQKQTEETFGYKWHQRDTFGSKESRLLMREWLVKKYGDLSRVTWWDEYGESPVVLDAGCGAAFSAIELFKGLFDEISYLGADISRAVDVAKERFEDEGLNGEFLQCDLGSLPFQEESIDVIFSEGVLHHTDSTENALKSLSKLVRPGGRFLFYVYNKKGPIREYTDDYIREKISDMSSEESWEYLKPLSKFGEELGKMDVTINVPEDIEVLDMPAGKMSLQRFFYWHIFKGFYHEDLTFEEMHHINFDWYAPTNAARQTPEEVRKWCEESNMIIEREVIEPAGITIVAKKKL